MKSAEQEALEMLIVGTALEWIKKQREHLRANHVYTTTMSISGGSSDMVRRHEDYAMERYAYAELAAAESKLVGLVCRLEKCATKGKP
jgi:hypothetical protein